MIEKELDHEIAIELAKAWDSAIVYGTGWCKIHRGLDGMPIVRFVPLDDVMRMGSCYGKERDQRSDETRKQTGCRCEKKKNPKPKRQNKHGNVRI